MRAPLLTVAAVMAIWPGGALPQIITDGATIKLNGTTYRLWGIDAPETKRLCGDYPAGVLPAATLETLTKGKRPRHLRS